MTLVSSSAGTAETWFDPTSDFFVAQFARPAGLQPLNLRTLTPFQRALLVIDGTVTKFIEAYTMEPVEVVRIGQARQVLSEDQGWLETPKGSPVLARHVILRGQYSDTLYAYALSLISIDRLPSDLRSTLDAEGSALGRMLLGGGVETRREVLWCGKERASGLPEAIRHLTDGEFIVRTYRIIARGQPIMLINEKFPLGSERLPSLD